MNNIEKKTVSKMICIYCKAKHGTTSGSLCSDCCGLEDYALKRLDYCKFGESKPTCQHCPVHCYKPEMKIRIQNIMRFSGPRMILYNPILALRHLIRNYTSNKRL